MSHSMCNCGLRTGLVAVGILLAWSLGCQTEGPHSAPGALPAGPASATAPSLNASTYYTYAHLLERQGNFQPAGQKYRQAQQAWAARRGIGAVPRGDPAKSDQRQSAQQSGLQPLP